MGRGSRVFIPSLTTSSEGVHGVWSLQEPPGTQPGALRRQKGPGPGGGESRPQAGGRGSSPDRVLLGPPCSLRALGLHTPRLSTDMGVGVQLAG